MKVRKSAYDQSTPKPNTIERINLPSLGPPATKSPLRLDTGPAANSPTPNTSSAERKIQRIELAEIVTGAGHRPIDEDHVEILKVRSNVSVRPRRSLSCRRPPVSSVLLPDSTASRRCAAFAAHILKLSF